MEEIIVPLDRPITVYPDPGVFRVSKHLRKWGKCKLFFHLRGF